MKRTSASPVVVAVISLNGEVDQEGNLWFFTSASSHKVSEVSRTPKCNAGFAAPDDNRYVSISGTAELVKDKSKIEELWKPELKAWFPEGAEQPDLALLRVGIEKAEFWDGPSSTIAQVVSFVRRSPRANRQSYGENKKLELQ